MPSWQPLFIIACLGALIIGAGLCLQVLQLIASIKERNKNRDATGDPWNGRTLEWSTTSPPPFYNFAITPEVHEKDAFWVMKESRAIKNPSPSYKKIHMPRNTPYGFYIGAFSFLFGFGMIWYMFWLAIISGVGILACIILRLYENNTDYYVSVEEIKNIEMKRRV
ncbi:MAG: hypothetical protein LVR00_08900 [Rhabdochlamydiaceae bacterium]